MGWHVSGVLALVLSAATVGPAAPLQDAAATNHAREGFELYRKAVRDAERITTAAQARLAALEPGDEEGRRLHEERILRARQGELGARLAFIHEFTKSDWESWELPADGPLLEEGLLGVGERYLSDDPLLAVKALDLLLAKVPDAASASRARYVLLPSAYLNSGDAGLALEGLGALLDSDPGTGRPALRLAIGDALALKGDLEAARHECEEALGEIPEDLEPQDLRARVRGSLSMRLALLGKPPPEIDSREWLGWQPEPLSKLLAGHVVVLDFWASWHSACRMLMPRWDDYYRENAERGLLVVGVTRFYEAGFLPELREAMNAGEAQSDMSATEFFGHLERFRANTRIVYPFVIAAPDEYERYALSGLPVTLLIGRDGKVRFVAEGGSKETVLRRLIEAELE